MIQKINAYSCFPYEERKTNKATYFEMNPLVFEPVKTEYDMVRFYRQTRTCDGISYDDSLDYGLVKDRYHTILINGKEIQAYSARCGMGIHSFCYVDIDTDGEFSLDVEVKINDGEYDSCLILPEKRNCNASIRNNTVTFKISEYNDYTVCIGENNDIRPEKALTIYVAKKRKLIIPQSYKTVTFDDQFPSVDISLDEEQTFYIFKAGHYVLNSISIIQNSIVYFEEGCFIEFIEKSDKPCIYNKGENVTILGRCLMDFSHIQGGYTKKKNPINFANLNEGFVEGVIAINSNTWTMCFYECDNIETCHNLMLGYRTFSDGIMFSGCRNCLTHHNFIRNGDDALEVKATSSRAIESNNLLFEHNSVWTDKANAFGVIFESNANINNVVFRYNSVGFAQAAWSEFVACFSIQRGTNYPFVWKNIRFEDSEVYYSNNPLISIYCSTINQYDYGDPLGLKYGGYLENLFYKNLSLKRQERSQLPVDCSISIRYLLNKDHPEYISHLKLKNVHLDNINYLGTILNKDNIKDSGIFVLPENFEWKVDDINFDS